MYRRAGLTHALTIDPIMIGSRPRYRLADVEAWLEAQKPGAVHDWAPQTASRTRVRRAE